MDDRGSEPVTPAEGRLRALLEASLDAIVAMDHRGRVLEFNRSAEHIFGYRRHQVVDQDLAERLLPPQVRPGFRRRLEHFLANGRSRLLGRRIELTAMRADGSEFPAEMAFSVADLPGPPLFVAFTRDLTGAKRVEEELRSSRRQLEAILRDVGDAITVQDATGNLVFANERAARMIGFDTVEELLAASPEELLVRFEILDEDGRPLPLAELPGRAVLVGAAVAERLIGYRELGGERTRWSRVRATPVRDDQGRVRLAINVFHDVTERRRNEERREFLLEVNQVLGRSLEFEEILTDLADLLVPRLADWCAVDLLEPDGSVRPLALAHVEPDRLKEVRAIRDGWATSLDDDRLMARVLRTGRSELIQEVTEEVLEDASARHPEYGELLRGLGLRSVIGVPLRVRGRILGGIALASERRSYDQADLALAEDVARRAAVAIDNARLYLEQAKAARTLQRSLLPDGLPEVPGLELEAHYRPLGAGNEVGGDFYDVFPLGDERWGVVLGDVEGKGVEAASLVALARYTLRTAARYDPRPHHPVRLLNQALGDDPRDLLCTVVYGLLEREGGGFRLHLASAGHPPALVLRRSGKSRLVGRPAPLLGAYGELEVTEHHLELEPGDAVVLYTDGLALEDRAAPESLRVLLEGCPPSDARGLVTYLMDRVDERHPEGLRDDLAVLVARVVGSTTS